jgi:hypothetical protein
MKKNLFQIIVIMSIAFIGVEAKSNIIECKKKSGSYSLSDFNDEICAPRCERTKKNTGKEKIKSRAEAVKNLSSYASSCPNSEKGPGYICYCE